MKWSLKGFSLPTPAKVRGWAHAINAACATSAGISFASDFKWFAGGLLVAGFIANFLADFFHEEPNANTSG
jgi:hypothetical protein